MNRHVFAAVAGIVALVVLAYGPSLNNQFVNWDDDAHLLNNPFILSFNIKDMFTTTVNKIYIPLTSLSFALEHHFFQANPFVYHFNNLILHLTITALVFWFCQLCGLSSPAAAAASLIFGLHPAHVESVAWITERKDLLYAVFYMAALISYARYIQRGRKEGNPPVKLLALTIFFGILSILAKPMALSLPLVMFLLDWFFRRRITARVFIEKVYCGLAVIPIAWVTYALLRGTQLMQFPESVLTLVWCFVFYIKKMFYPDYFVLIYKFPLPVALTNPSYSIALAVFVILFLTLWILRKNRLYIFANLFYVFSIFFVLRLDPMVGLNVVGDRFMYLPMLGWCMLLGHGYVDLWTRYQHSPRLRITILLTGVAVLSFLFFQTIRQSRVWYNGASLWEHQLRYQQDAATALIYNKLAQAYIQEPGFENNPGKIQTAEDYLHKAIAIKPDYAQAYFHSGQLAACKKDFALAQAHFKKTIELDGGHFDAYFQLGWLYDQAGQYSQAMEAFHKAIEARPDHEGMYRQILDFYDAAIAAGRQIYAHERDGLAKEYIDRFRKYP